MIIALKKIKGLVSELLNMPKMYCHDFWFRLSLYLKAKSVLRNYYPKVSFKSLKNERKSNTVFVLGSGYSINDLSSKEIKKMEESAIFAFSGFLEYNKSFRLDYYLGREFSNFDNTLSDEDLEKLTMTSYHFPVKSNNSELCKNTVFFIQQELHTVVANVMIALKKFKADRKIFCFKNYKLRSLFKFPRKSLKNVVHYGGTLSDVVHVCYALGFKKIVLAGVDLYDRRYFWLKYDETISYDISRDKTVEDEHNTAKYMVDYFRECKEYLNKHGVQLYVYNEKSLLNQCLPVLNYKDQV